MDKQAARTRAIVAVGFSEARRADVLDRIESIFEVHRELTSAGESLGSLADLRAEIEKVARTAEKLLALINDLPNGARTYLGFPSSYKIADEVNPLATLIERAQRYHESVQRGGGRPKNENLRGLLYDLMNLWDDELPNVVGITRDGSGPDDGRAVYKGPLFDCVRSLLDAEEIRYHSAEALGRQLWELWRDRRRADERHAVGRCVSCEKELQDKARWQCDDCRGWPWPQATVQEPL